MINILKILLTIIISCCTCFLIFIYLVKPKVLENLCLVDSGKCLHLQYWAFENSVLTQLSNTGIWVWFNGDRAFIYGQPVGQICPDPDNFSAVYSINTNNGVKEGYKCVVSLKKVIEFYQSKNVSEKTLIKKINPTNFDIYDLLNLLDKEDIINLSSSGK
jgi:hypothetical protein